MPQEPIEPKWEVTEDILETVKIYREDSKLVRSQLKAIFDWYVEMRKLIKEK